MSDKLLLTIPEAAARLGYSRRTMGRIMASGKLRVVRPTGGHPRVTPADLDAYLKRTGRKPRVARNVASNNPDSHPTEMASNVLNWPDMPIGDQSHERAGARNDDEWPGLASNGQL